MGNLSEMAAYFPGTAEEKKIISLHLNLNTAVITYTDGTQCTISDPVQLQNLKMHSRQEATDFTAYMRKSQPEAWRGMYFERTELEQLLKEWRDSK